MRLHRRNGYSAWTFSARGPFGALAHRHRHGLAFPQLVERRTTHAD